MSKPNKTNLSTLGIMLSCIFFLGCSKPQPWPEGPLYETPINAPEWVPPATKSEAMAALEGHYAHYDIVAYNSDSPNGPLYTFIISYGFTDLVVEQGELVEYDQFCHSEHKANQNMVTSFSDEATQAIVPRSAVVQVFQEAGEWKIWRPATPTLIGIDGDPDVTLSMDPNDPNINDDDGDGKPGVTVDIKLFGLIDAELYIARREIFQNDLTLYSDGSIQGHVVDGSEQLVIGASLSFLNKPNNPPQHSDLSLSPMMLIPIADDVDTCDELMAMRDSLFPEEPGF